MRLPKRPRFVFSTDATRFLEVARGWWMHVPGRPSFDRDNGALIIWDDRWTIRVTSVTISWRAGTEGPIPAEEMLGPVEGLVERTKHGILLNLGPERVEVLDGRPVRIVPTQAAAPNSLVVLDFQGHERDVQERAHATARTLHYVPMPAPS